MPATRLFLSAGGNSYVAATAGNFGIGTSTPNNKFSLFAPATADAAAQAIISTNGTANKGLVVQGVASQSANVFEVQNNAGSNLISVGSNGAFYASNSAAIHTTPLSGSILSVLGATGGSAPGIVYRASTSTGDAIQLQDSAGNVNAVFNAAGNRLTLGRVAASGTVTQGKLVLSDGTTDNYGLTLQSATLTSSQTITFAK